MSAGEVLALAGVVVVLVVVIGVVAGVVRLFGRGRRDGAQPAPPGDAAPAPAEPTPQQEAAALRGELTTVVRATKRAGGTLPVAAVPTVQAIADVLDPLLQYVERQSANAEELHQLTSLVRQYLPRAVEQYAALPEAYALADRSGPGTSPADDLVAQLDLLLDGSKQLQRAIYDRDAQQLAIGRRFLDTKFRRSDLDL